MKKPLKDSDKRRVYLNAWELEHMRNALELAYAILKQSDYSILHHKLRGIL